MLFRRRLPDMLILTLLVLAGLPGCTKNGFIGQKTENEFQARMGSDAQQRVDHAVTACRNGWLFWSNRDDIAYAASGSWAPEFGPDGQPVKCWPR